MSENNNELGLVADASEQVSKRRLLLVGGGAFVVVALIARLLLGGGTDDTATVGAPPAVATAAPVAEEVAPVVPASFTGVVGKDPFTPVVEPPPPAPPAPPPPPPPPPPEPVAPPAPQVVVVQAPAATGPRTLRLTQVVPQGESYRVTLTVNGQLYDVAFGQTFADTFAAQSLASPGCVSFAHGEEPFDLCEGQERTF